MRIVALCSLDGEKDKSSLIFHLAWMYAERGVKVLALDLDPHCHLTRLFLPQARQEEIWSLGGGQAAIEAISSNLRLLPGSFRLADIGDEVNPRALTDGWASLVLIDPPSNLDGLTRAVLRIADHVVFPISPDLYSFQSLTVLGDAVSRWGDAKPAGYIVTNHTNLDHQRWLGRIPAAYRRAVLKQPEGALLQPPREDPNCLMHLPAYRSLMPLAVEARKPVFELRPFDGALGAFVEAVLDSRKQFRQLTDRLSAAIGLEADHA
jgi:cellulose biosynthesis protein BcsQ